MVDDVEWADIAMTLRALHDFELRLLAPCIAMTERGIRVDEARRQRMLADLDAMRAPLLAEAQCLGVEALTDALAAKLAGKPVRFKTHLFLEKWTCPCCRGGGEKRAACWACAGFPKKPGKKALDGRTLEPCKVCDGVGKRETLAFNPDSHEQIKIVLYDVLKLPKRTKDGKLRSDEEALKEIAWQDDTGLVKALLQIAKAGTMREILERIAPAADGRIRTFYNPAGTETGRFSSSGGRPDAAPGERWALVESTNLQNMPKREVTDPRFDVRSCFVADEGCVLVEADLSGAEAWVTAACCGDRDLLSRLREGLDVHRWTAAHIFGKPVGVVTPTERHLGKVARHALNYGMQAVTFARNVNAESDRTGVGVDVPTARRIYDAYHALHPQLELWWREVQRALEKRGWLETCFGRRRTFFGRGRGEWLGDTHREAIAFEPQATVADLLNRGLLRWWERCEGRHGELLMQVHDSVVVQAPIARSAIVARLLESCLREEIEVHGIAIAIPVTVTTATHWGVGKEAT